jgi:carbamoyl-phosphate synthase large subunit
MSKKKNFSTVMILGSGPITIGQACEFDYSGTQACRALKEEGYRVVLLNSNPATIMTDPGVADRTYIEPLDPSVVIEILRKEGVDAILPTMGGQTALNLIMNLANIPHALDGVEIIGANLRAIHLAENRRAFRELALSLGMDSPKSIVIRNVEDARGFAEECGFPFILRPSFTLGGSGQSMVYTADELVAKTRTALEYSPIGEALVEESVKGWKEFELEVMRDSQDNAIVVCSIENLDAMGVHTGDSITVAPQQTLTDREYQAMRWDALRLIRAVGVETGGCNVQFAVNPLNGRRVVIEMNPRVSRSSALASKATGFPIAYVATKLAIGYNLSDVDNRITESTKACFEPPIDYVALKIPRWHFEKFPGAIDELLPQMQSVGEVLSFGTSLGEAYHKALNSLERKWPVFEPVDSQNAVLAWKNEKQELLVKPHSKRAYAVWDALACGLDPVELAHILEWDPWFTRQIRLYQEAQKLGPRAKLLPSAKAEYQMIDTCSGENRVKTSYFYSSREHFAFDAGDFAYTKSTELKLPADKRGRAVILGSGPNRIGQGVEFDYCCVHASLALLKLGYETIMVNCNPETVSTDPTTSTRLYLEPLHEDSVKAVLAKELDPVKAEGRDAFVVVQMGGQTPLKLASKIESWGYRILGTKQESIDLCEDRERFANFLEKNEIRYPPFAATTSLEETLKLAKKIGYPLLVRPSYVLGGRGMKICYSDLELTEAFHNAKQVNSDYPLYLDKYLKDAIEYDIDGLCDGKKAWVAGVMEHVEEAGIHSGDSSCVIPPFRLPAAKIDEMAGIAKKIALGSGGRGLFNIQMAVVGEEIYVIEANPRASRTVPFLAKATGYNLVEWAIRSALGEESVSEIVREAPIPGNYRLPSHGYAVKTPVFPFEKFRNVDPLLGPEMRSTGEVMGVGPNAGDALAKSFLASGVKLPEKGGILLSVKDRDKTRLLPIARGLSLLGFRLLGTPGTAAYLSRAGVDCEQLAKIGQAPMGQDLLHHLQSGRVQMIVNTTDSASSFRDGESIRQIALRLRIPLMSTISAAEMALMAIERLKKGHIPTVCLQDFIAGAQLTQV